MKSTNSTEPRFHWIPFLSGIILGAVATSGIWLVAISLIK